MIQRNCGLGDVDSSTLSQKKVAAHSEAPHSAHIPVVLSSNHTFLWCLIPIPVPLLLLGGRSLYLAALHAARAHHAPSMESTPRWDHEECEFLSALQHPNIVQYLGVHEDPDTRQPLLLMELMNDENLTKFLDNSPSLLPFHVEVNMAIPI